MKLTIATFVVTLTVASALQDPFTFDNGFDCCPLEWLPVIKSGLSRFIPRSAIEAGFDRSRKLYFVKSPLVQDSFGVIDDSVYGAPGFYSKGFEIPWQDSLVLSNPHGCDISWWKREDISQHPPEVSERLFPRSNGKFFARLKYSKDKEKKSVDRQVLGYKEYDRSTFYLINLEYKKVESIANAPDLEMLYVNCTSSIKKLLTSQLYDIQYDIDKLIKHEEQVTLAATRVDNLSPDEEETEISLNAEITSSLQMTHETHLNETTNVDYTIHGSASMNFVIGLFGSVSGTVDGHYSRDTLMSNFTRTGKVSISMKKTAFKFKQLVRTKSLYTSEIKITMTPVEGTVPFVARYKIIPTVNEEAWNNEKIIAALKRSGFEDWSLIKEENQTLTIDYRGSLSVEAGMDTRIEIKSHPYKGQTLHTNNVSCVNQFIDSN